MLIVSFSQVRSFFLVFPKVVVRFFVNRAPDLETWELLWWARVDLCYLRHIFIIIIIIILFTYRLSVGFMVTGRVFCRLRQLNTTTPTSWTEVAVQIMPFVGHRDRILRRTVTAQIQTTSALPIIHHTLFIFIRQQDGNIKENNKREQKGNSYRNFECHRMSCVW